MTVTTEEQSVERRKHRRQNFDEEWLTMVTHKKIWLKSETRFVELQHRVDGYGRKRWVAENEVRGFLTVKKSEISKQRSLNKTIAPNALEEYDGEKKQRSSIFICCSFCREELLKNNALLVKFRAKVKWIEVICAD